MIQLRRRDSVFSPSASERARLRREFDRRGCVRLPGFLEPRLIWSIQDQIDKASFRRMVHTRSVAVEDCLEGGHPVSRLLLFLMNHPPLFKAVQSITGSEAVRRFNGRVYRLVPGAGHTMQWHRDTDGQPGRLIGVSVNLSRGLFRGGVFQIRRRGSREILREVANTGFGDALLFQISGDFEHRVTDVRKGPEKTALAGWFYDWGSVWVPPAGKERLLDKRGAASRVRAARGPELRIPEQVFSQREGEGVLLYLPSRAAAYRLNRVAGRYWRLLERIGSAGAAFEAMRREYSVGPERLRRDLMTLTRDLEARGFLVAENRSKERSAEAGI